MFVLHIRMLQTSFGYIGLTHSPELRALELAEVNINSCGIFRAFGRRTTRSPPPPPLCTTLSIIGEVNNNFLAIYASSYIPACVEGLSTIRASAANYEWWYWDSATPRSDPTADPINTTLHRLQSLSNTKEVTPKS